MKQRKRLLLLLLLVITLLFTVSIPAMADFGEFAGNNDYGGDWDSGWDSGWDGGSDYDYDYETGLGIGYLLGSDAPPLLVIIVIIILVVLRFKKSKTQHRRPVAPGAAAASSASLRPISELKAKDPGFSSEEMIEKLSNLYVQMQHCWTARDLEPLRPYFTDALYSQMERQVENYRRNGQINHVERIAVLGVDLRGFKTDETNDTLIAQIRTRIVDYVVSEETGAVIRGDKTRELFMEYEYTLIRSKDSVTKHAEETVDTTNCPNCGAPLDVNHSAKCPYCDSVLQSKEYDWAISSIKGLSQRSGQ